MKIEKIAVAVRFVTETLATSPGNSDILSEYIAKRAPGAEKAQEELDALPANEQTEKASTVFSVDEKGLFCWDYQWRGFFKEAIRAQIDLGDFPKLSAWNYKRAVDSFLFVNPRRIHYLNEEGLNIKEPHGVKERPLRAETMQGDRVALARSEMLKEGVSVKFELSLLLPGSELPTTKKTGEPKKTAACITPELVKTCLEYGNFKGFSQWRGGGFGRFEILKFDVAPTKK